MEGLYGTEGRVIKMEGWIEGAVKSNCLKSARKGNELEKMMGRIVDGAIDFCTPLRAMGGLRHSSLRE